MRNSKPTYIGNTVILAMIVTVVVGTSLCWAQEKADSSKYLKAVQEFADNVLKYGRDTYGPKHTPLFVDGLNVNSREPVKWISKDGDRWILSNMASQQNLFRTLDGLTRITGNPQYRQAAVEAIEYAFENLRSPNGLLYWGNTTAYDAQKDKAVGQRMPKDYAHVLKANLPYYELMWQVNPAATKTFIESFWSAHVKNWSNLAMNRIGEFNDVLEEPWKHTYDDGPVFLKSGSGISFLNTGTDLIYAAGILSKLSGDKEPLVWSKRIVRRYVRTRHPNTGISYWMYAKPSFTVLDSYDTVMRKLVPGTTEFLPSDFPWSHYTNPLFREVTRGQFTPTPGISIHQQVFYWQTQFLVGEILAGEGDEFKQWALEELTAFGKASYRKKDNVYVPMLTDGTNLEGYVVKMDSGLLGPKGVTLEPVPVGPPDLWAYAMGYRVTNDSFMWEMARNISKGNDFRDIGVTPKDDSELDYNTNCPNPYALLAFLELYRATGKDEFLNMAKRIGDNILSGRFHKGFFVASTEHVYTKFDAIDSLGLLHLYSALAEESANTPEAWPSLPYFYCSYRSKDWANDNAILYTRTEPSDPPLSLLEAASLGDIEEVRSIISRGTGVNDLENSFFKTALHQAIIKDHKDMVEFLLDVKDIDISARDSFSSTPLRYAVEGGHKEIVELLIDSGADVNDKDGRGKTALDYAKQFKKQEIIELLKKYGAKE
ncbi:ankyrin repeat domain-containing protein [Planctomycetota bacterium]